MPIASPPPDYKLDRPGCSGLAVGADIEIKDDKGMRIEPGSTHVDHKGETRPQATIPMQMPNSEQCAGRQVGSICVRGSPTFLGYENNDDANAESFFADGYFNTGGWAATRAALTVLR